MFDFDVGCDPDQLCRDDRCDLVGLHTSHKVVCSSKPPPWAFRTKSRRWKGQPWRANCTEALRDSVRRGVSFVEPRNFSMVLAYVRDDYGSCCPRSVHRHLATLRASGDVVRLDFHGKIHAYLRAGSRLIRSPGLVLEQILDLYAEGAF